ncbi:serine hydrolase domain-containing protein [Paraglaciecola sp. 2405UD69-4]|uniref:serine hydrolase domain-containing protein n=1 Tax=Paraglaciecola sp. 2405UD69-4 TaxID=3391836 RepID=UPI0039C9F77D
MFIQKKFQAILFSALALSLCSSYAQEDTTHQATAYHRDMYQNYEHKEFDLGGEPSRFAWREMPGLFPHTTIFHNHTRKLPIALTPAIKEWTVTADNKPIKFDDYVSQDSRIDSVIIIHNGKIVYQRYKTLSPLERHLTWSVTKVITASALARLEEMGKVDMQAPVKKYLADFASSVWGDIKLQDVIDMASGINCRDGDGYQNTQACVYRAEETYGVVPQVRANLSKAREYLKSMKAHRNPGEATEYSSSNTNIASLVIEEITQKPLARAISDLVWQPMGAEADGLMLVNQYGEAYASGGISARMSDIARFGLMYLDNQGWGQLGSAHLDFLKNSPRPIFTDERKQELEQLFDGDAPLHSRWQWDLIWEDGDMFKSGYSGQGLYISPSNNMVMAWFGTDDTNFNTHNLLPLSRKLSKAKLLTTKK